MLVVALYGRMLLVVLHAVLWHACRGICRRSGLRLVIDVACDAGEQQALAFAMPESAYYNRHIRLFIM